MGMGPGGYNYVPQLSHASTAGFGSQYGAADLSHAYDTTRHTANSWYSPSAATDPTSRFNEYACKYYLPNSSQFIYHMFKPFEFGKKFHFLSTRHSFFPQ